MSNTLSLLSYKILDWLKQESPFWWAVVQSLLWGSFGLISTSWVDFKGEEVVLVFIGGLISSVGTRTTKKLSESKNSPVNDSNKPVVNPEEFKQRFKQAQDRIEETKQEFQLKEEFIILNKPLIEGQWLKQKGNKTQIVLHHSVSSNIESLVNWWNTDKSRIGTAYSIDKDGIIYNHFPDDEWAYHLYINSPGNKIKKGLKRISVQRDKDSIGIELISAGGLMFKDDNWYSSFNSVIPKENVYETNYRGFKGFEKYTDKQIASLNFLLKSLCKKYNIPFTVPTFDIEDNALKGKPGIYSHTSYRTDKSDCYPDKDLIQVLNSLNK